MKKSGFNILIGKTSIIFYIHNPWLTRHQLRENGKYAQYWLPSDQKKYSDFHPVEDELLSSLKQMIRPPNNRFKSQLADFHYWLDKMKRRLTDPKKIIFKNYQELLTNMESTLNSDKKNIKHYNEIKARNEQALRELKLKVAANRISERAILVSTSPNVQH